MRQLACADDLRMALGRLTEQVGRPDLIIHLAAQAAVGSSFTSPAESYQVNVVGTALLLQTLAEITPEGCVLIPSSSHVYASAPTPQPLDESSPIGPSSHYGASKLAQEEVGKIFFRATGLRVFITRAFNHIGPGQHRGFALPDFARQIVIIERAAEERSEPPKLYVGNLEARRDYLDVRDVVDAYLTVVEKGEPGVPYNVGSGLAWSARELLGLLLTETSVPVMVEQDSRLMRPCDVPVIVGDASRLRSLGWKPRHDIPKTVRETLDFWRKAT